MYIICELPEDSGGLARPCLEYLANDSSINSTVRSLQFCVDPIRSSLNRRRVPQCTLQAFRLFARRL